MTCSHTVPGPGYVNGLFVPCATLRAEDMNDFANDLMRQIQASGSASSIVAGTDLAAGITTAGGVTSSLATWMSLLTGTSNPNPVVFGGTASLNGGGALGGTFSGNPNFSGAPALSTGLVTSPGSVTARSLAARSADVINVLDWLTAGQPDGTTDNTTQLQAAINAAAGKAVVYFPKTTSNYIVSTQTPSLVGSTTYAALNIPSNSHLVIDGTILLKANSLGGQYSSVIFCNATSNIVIEGVGTVDGNMANQLIGAFPANYQIGVGGINCNSILISGLTIQNSSGSGFTFYSTNGLVADNLKLLNSKFANQVCGDPGGFTGIASNNCWIRNCTITGTTDFGFAFYDGVTNSGITGSYVASGTSTGIGVLTDGGFFQMCSNIVIKGNVVANNGGRGISSAVTGSAIGHGVHSSIIISDNQVYGHPDHGIITQYTSDVSITGNAISANGYPNGTAGVLIGVGTTDYLVSENIIRANKNGIIFNNTPVNGTVTNNAISNCNDHNGAASAIAWLAVSTNTVVTGNHIYDDQGSPTTHWGIFAANPGTNAVIMDNVISNATIPYAVTPASDTVLVKAGTTSGGVDFVTAVTAPTIVSTDNSTSVATTAFVKTAIAPVYFQAYLSADQSVTANTTTKVAFNTVVFDSGSYYDAVTNFRYTPLVAGKYRVSTTVRLTCSTGTASGTNIVRIFKGGTEYAGNKFLSPNGNNTETSMTVTTLVSMNGSTDYLEVWAVNPGTVGQVFGAGLSSFTHFEAERIGA